MIDRTIEQGPNGVPLTYTPSAGAGAGAYDIAAAWVRDLGTTRVLRVPVSALGVGTHRLYLAVPGGNDLDLGVVVAATRT